ncbi:hypothetical protein F66182_8601 [Fusarium sp. NRRL 66182]|nr:hypothetical protein F66182_8601 [Fusarium sp. NRRL 66182]
MSKRSHFESEDDSGSASRSPSSSQSRRKQARINSPVAQTAAERSTASPQRMALQCGPGFASSPDFDLPFEDSLPFFLISEHSDEVETGPGSSSIETDSELGLMIPPYPEPVGQNLSDWIYGGWEPPRERLEELDRDPKSRRELLKTLGKYLLQDLEAEYIIKLRREVERRNLITLEVTLHNPRPRCCLAVCMSNWVKHDEKQIFDDYHIHIEMKTGPRYHVRCLEALVNLPNLVPDHFFPYSIRPSQGANICGQYGFMISEWFLSKGRVDVNELETYIQAEYRQQQDRYRPAATHGLAPYPERPKAPSIRPSAPYVPPLSEILDSPYVDLRR